MQPKTDLKDFIRNVPDYPKPGIMFLDIAPLLASPEAFHNVIHEFVSMWGYGEIDGIAALDARGFVFGSALAYELKVPLAMVRKRGKLPGEVEVASYSLEYGTSEVEMHKDAFPKGSHILIVDDVLATGGTAKAAATLLKKIGCKVEGYAFVIEIKSLGGRAMIGDADIQSLIMS